MMYNSLCLKAALVAAALCLISGELLIMENNECKFVDLKNVLCMSAGDNELILIYYDVHTC